MAAARLGRRARRRGKRVALVTESRFFSERLRWHEQVLTADMPPGRVLDLMQVLPAIGVEVIEARIEEVDLAARLVVTGKGAIRYDRLILATGSASADHGVAGVRTYGYVIDRAGERANAALRTRVQTIAPKDSAVISIVGSGPTGIELAGELVADARFLVRVISAGAFAEFVAPSVQQRLRRMAVAAGVELIENCRVRRVTSTNIETDDAGYPSDITIWCAGMEGAGPGLRPEPSRDSDGRLRVDENLRLKDHPEVCVVGDACRPWHDTGAPPRMSAFFALATGAYAADSQTRRRGPFRFGTYGQGIGFGRDGVGFSTFPNDRANPPYFTGRAAFGLRNFFVALLFRLLLWQIRFGAFPFVPPPLRRMR